MGNKGGVPMSDAELKEWNQVWEWYENIGNYVDFSS